MDFEALAADVVEFHARGFPDGEIQVVRIREIPRRRARHRRRLLRRHYVVRRHLPPFSGTSWSEKSDFFDYFLCKFIFTVSRTELTLRFARVQISAEGTVEKAGRG